MIKSNGGIIGPDNVTTGGFNGVASGVFKLGEVTKLIRESKWPEPSPFTNTVPNSARFNTASSDSLTRTQSASPTSATKGTLSFWIKRSLLGTAQYFMSTFQDSNNRVQCEFQANDTLRIIQKNSSSTTINIITNRVFRDSSAFYHVVLAFDTTQGTDSNRVKLYINGDQETSFSTSTYPGSGIDSFLTKGTSASLGAYNGTGDYSSAYFSEIVLIDGQQLTPSSFAETNSDSGIWIPKTITGLTFGTNGYYLKFTNASALGEDFSGNDNDFTVNNLTSVDQSTDTPSNNFSTWDPLVPSQGGFTPGSPTFAEGSCKYTTNNSTNNFSNAYSTFLLTQGKWYTEIKYTKSGTPQCTIGIRGSNGTTVAAYIGYYAYDYGYSADGGGRFTGGSQTSYGASYASGDIIGIALDLDSSTKTVTFYKNNASQGAITIADPSVTDFNGYTINAAEWDSANNSTFEVNFGNPSFTISSGNTDGNGFGNFEYAPPTGYVSLCTNNLNVLE